MPEKRPILSQVAYSFGGYALGIYAAFTTALLPLYLLSFTKNTALIGVLVTNATFQTAIISLFVGPLTDRIRWRFGGRKLFILVGSIGTVSMLLLIPRSTSFIVVMVLIVLAGLARSLTIAPHLAMLTENSPPDKRGQISAFTALFGLLGQITITLLGYFVWKSVYPPEMFTLLSILFLLPMIAVLVFSQDTPTKQSNIPLHLRRIPAFFADKPRKLYLLSQFFLWFGINSVIPFFTLFMTEYLSLTSAYAMTYYFDIALASGIFAYPFALLGKRLGDLRAFQLGLLAFAVAALLGIFAKDLPLAALHLLALFAGFGNSASIVFSYALLSKLTNESTMGLTSGIYTFLVSGFAPIAALLSGLLISHFGYPSMFFILAGNVVLALLFLRSKTLLFAYEN